MYRCKFGHFILYYSSILFPIIAYKVYCISKVSQHINALLKTYHLNKKGEHGVRIKFYPYKFLSKVKCKSARLSGINLFLVYFTVGYQSLMHGEQGLH